MKLPKQLKSYLPGLCVFVFAVVPLCISDSAGPRLFPLGPAVEPTSTSVRSDFATSVPSRDCSRSGYFELICGFQFRQRDRQDDVQTVETAIAPALQLSESYFLGAGLFSKSRKSQLVFPSRLAYRGPPSS